ncbi:hypothetical protein ES711_11440 [Gelidibacter salicanalis]|uniref:Uncharacterized protein n=1 Tax=Gelidibacter salicanalis TaxID=291193 RepID=A0A5C7AIQ3_9FLAO|nr:hypothetical protein [Gelidibacter salicanalis]TXE07373.1 hypothetical protein ES711_11440 [Gelidibacter salicanalis]
MKKAFLVGLSLFIFNTYSIAQGQGKGHQKEKFEKVQNQGKHKGENAKSNAHKNSEQSHNGAQGHAYGKNKEGLEGKEFGQQRAYDAKRTAQARKMYADQIIKGHVAKIRDNEERLKVAKERVEKQRKDGQISAKIEKEKMEKIKQAEDKIKKMKDLVEKNKKEVKDLEKQLDKLD